MYPVLLGKCFQSKPGVGQNKNFCEKCHFCLKIFNLLCAYGRLNMSSWKPVWFLNVYHNEVGIFNYCKIYWSLPWEKNPTCYSRRVIMDNIALTLAREKFLAAQKSGQNSL